MHIHHRGCGSPPKSADLLRARLNCGWVEALGQTFFAEALVYLSDALQKRVTVVVAVDPDDLSRAWIRDQQRYRWIEAPNLYPTATPM
jgi:Mu transposase, C-terminal